MSQLVHIVYHSLWNPLGEISKAKRVPNRQFNGSSRSREIVPLTAEPAQQQMMIAHSESSVVKQKSDEVVDTLSHFRVIGRVFHRSNKVPCVKYNVNLKHQIQS